MLKKILQLLSDSLAYGISGLLGQLIGVLLLPLYTRRLQPADYGVLAMLAFVPPAFSTLAAAGIKSAIFQQFYKHETDGRRRIVLSTAAASVLLSMTLLLAISLPSAGWIARWLIGDEAAAHLVRLSLAAAAIATLTDIPLIALQALRRAKTVGMLNITQLLVVVAVTVYLVAVARIGVLGVVLGGLIGSCVALVVCFLTAARYFTWGVDLLVWREMAAYSLPFLPHRLQATAMTFLGDYMIRTQLGLGDLGLYNVAMRFAVPIAFLAGTLQQAWNPYKFKVYAEDPDSGSFFRSTLTYYVFIISYIWLGVSIWGPEAVRLMTAPAFHGAAALVWAVALMRSAQAFYPMMATGVELGSNMRAVPLTSLASLVTVIVACVVLVPRFGAYGAAFATTSAWLVMAAGFYLVAQRQVPVDYDWASVAGLCAIAAVMIAAGQLLQTSPPWVRLPACLVMSLAYPPLGLLVLLQSPSERHRVEILTSRFFRPRPPADSGTEDDPASQPELSPLLPPDRS